MKNILTQYLAKYFLPGLSNVGFNLTSRTENLSFLNSTRKAIILISLFFSPINAIRSKPVFTLNANSVIIHVFYYIPVKERALNNNTVNNLGEALSDIFNKPVELRLVKQQFPYLNSYILAQYIALNAQDYTLVQIVRRVFSMVAPVKDTQSAESLMSILPSHIVGIKVQVSGRLITERSRPRKTIQTAELGSFSKGNLDKVDYASFTSKNKKGAFTVKVWISQRAVV